MLVEAQGPSAALDALVAHLRTDSPPLAVVDAVLDVGPVAPVAGERGFAVAASAHGGAGATALVPPDVGACDACLAEVADPQDRRHRYPFGTCTDCGPRFTVVTSTPYDRARTTMAGFPLCEDCAHEYADPHDRRFHAEPLACPACGPRLRLVAGRAPTVPERSEDAGGAAEDTIDSAADTGDSAEDAGDGTADTDGPAAAPWALRADERDAEGEAALAVTRRVVAAGGVVAVKGLGGYHLACDATDEAAVARLRRLKQRPDKPFALLVADVAATRALGCVVDDDEAAALTSPARPVVLLRHRPDDASTPVAASVAPRLDELGVQLPSTPLHALLVEQPVAPRSRAHQRQPGRRAHRPRRRRGGRPARRAGRRPARP